MTLSLWWLAYLGLGAFVGFVAGLLGVGGGALMVPILAMFFGAQGFPQEHIFHLALGTSMAAIIFTSISSLRTHHNHGAVHWNIVRTIIPGIVLGTFIGTLIAARTSTRGLATFFGCFILLVAVQMASNMKPKPGRDLPGRLAIVSVGVGIGALSALVAIGGGAMTVPWLTWCNVRVQHAIGTSAAMGLPIAVFGTLGYLWNGWSQQGLPVGSLGYLYLPAMLFVVIASVLTAPLGARAAHRLPVPVLKRIFALLLVSLSIKLLWSVWK